MRVGKIAASKRAVQHDWPWYRELGINLGKREKIEVFVLADVWRFSRSSEVPSAA